MNFTYANNFKCLLFAILGKVEPHFNTITPNYISIDDTTFSPQCVVSTVIPTGTPPPIKSNCTSAKPFSCVNNASICLPMSKVCDFYYDCPDASDERNCGKCSFETNDMCGLTNIGMGLQQWSLVSVSKFSTFSGVPKTKANGKTSGYFLMIDTSKG